MNKPVYDLGSGDNEDAANSGRRAASPGYGAPVAVPNSTMPHSTLPNAVPGNSAPDFPPPAADSFALSGSYPPPTAAPTSPQAPYPLPNGASSTEISHVAISQGMTTLRTDGWEKALIGLTSVEEILRVVA